mmetsp:Transcript_5538/g.9552  ORF Transcript_5538/g.9552 Transcript_5538/m.9552 type:complete len:88 (-) Transcript_5538:173-436(-)
MREYKNCTVFLTKQLEKEVLWTICFAGLEMSALAAKKPDMPKKTELAKGPKCITPEVRTFRGSRGWFLDTEYEWLNKMQLARNIFTT